MKEPRSGVLQLLKITEPYANLCFPLVPKIHLLIPKKIFWVPIWVLKKAIPTTGVGFRGVFVHLTDQLSNFRIIPDYMKVVDFMRKNYNRGQATFSFITSSSAPFNRPSEPLFRTSSVVFSSR